ncbi:hypothetical protein SGPA1_41248 [Streptomyces misionensis JCM 4497]
MHGGHCGRGHEGPFLHDAHSLAVVVWWPLKGERLLDGVLRQVSREPQKNERSLLLCCTRPWRLSRRTIDRFFAGAGTSPGNCPGSPSGPGRSPS